MKLPLILLLNVLVVGTGLFVYDTVRSDRRYDADPAIEADRSQLEARVSALEKRMADRGPELRSLGTEDLAARIIALEETMRSRATRPPAAAAAVGVSDEPFAPGSGEDLAARVDGDAVDAAGEASPNLSEKDVRQVQRLMEEAERRRRDEWMSQRLDRTLERLEMNLSDENKKRVLEASQTFRETMRSAFAGGPAASGSREDMAAVVETARAELTTTLESFLPASDAEQLVQALSMGGRRGPGSRGPGGGGRPGR